MRFSVCSPSIVGPSGRSLRRATKGCPLTYIFDPLGSRNLVATDAPEWNKRFPPVGPRADLAADVRNAFRTGARPTLPEEMPLKIVAEKPRKTWPDTFFTTNGLLVVRDPVRLVLEQLDPGEHQFFPLHFQTKRGLEIEDSWFAMNVTAKQDSILVEYSRVNVNPRAPDRLCSFYSDSKYGDVIVDPSKQKGLHFWREARFNLSLLGSDRLFHEMKKRKLHLFPSSFKAKDISDIR